MYDNSGKRKRKADIAFLVSSILCIVILLRLSRYTALTTMLWSVRHSTFLLYHGAMAEGSVMPSFLYDSRFLPV